MEQDAARLDRATLLAVLCGVLGAVISGADLHKVASVGTTNFLGRQLHLVHPEWGLYLDVGASVALAGFALALVVVGSRLPKARIAATAVVLLAIGTTVALTQVGVKRSQAAAGTSESSPSSTTPTTEGSTATTRAAPPSITTEEVQHLLNQYKTAYGAESIEQLEALFAPSLSRYNGKTTENRAQALATYRTQFSQLQNPSYSLSNVQISPGSSQASANGTYAISSQNGTVEGQITFHVIQTGSGPQIDRIEVHPAS